MRSCCMYFFLIFAFTLFSCDNDGHAGIKYVGEGGQPVPIRLASLTPEVDLDLSVQPGPCAFVLDTGSPVHLADVGHYPLTAGVYRLQMTGLGLLFPNVSFIFEDFFDNWLPICGLLGANLLVYFDWELDYPARSVTLYPKGFPERDPTDVQVSFVLAGGGRYRLSTGESVSVGATRHLVYIDVEGRRILALLDTGASYMVLKKSVMDTLGMVSRPDHGITQVVTAYGVVSAPLTELRQVAFASAAATLVENVYTVIVDDEFLHSLRVETGREVDALVGGAYLSLFRLRFAMKERIIEVHRGSAVQRFLTPRVHVRLPLPVEVEF